MLVRFPLACCVRGSRLRGCCPCCRFREVDAGASWVELGWALSSIPCSPGSFALKGPAHSVSRGWLPPPCLVAAVPARRFLKLLPSLAPLPPVARLLCGRAAACVSVRFDTFGSVCLLFGACLDFGSLVLVLAPFLTPFCPLPDFGRFRFLL